MTQLMKTSDYSIFKLLDYNRKLDIPNLDRITASLKIKNMLHLRPILVNKDMAILDGQHRFQAAKLLGLEIYYQVQEESTDEDIILLNSSQKGWTANDYLNYYARKGNQSYLEISRFCKQHDVRFDLLRSMIYGKDHSVMEKLRAGTLVFGEQEKKQAEGDLWALNEVMKVINRLSLDKGAYMRSGRMKLSIIDFLKIDGVDLEMFIKKISVKFDSIHVCATRTAYVEMFKGIYNWKNQNPVT